MPASCFVKCLAEGNNCCEDFVSLLVFYDHQENVIALLFLYIYLFFFNIVYQYLSLDFFFSVVQFPGKVVKLISSLGFADCCSFYCKDFLFRQNDGL